jgi:hypothetical protein
MLVEYPDLAITNMSRDEYIAFVKSEIVTIANAILNGETGIILGSRQLSSLRYELSDERDPDFNIFIAIDSETDHLPVDNERENWSVEALKRKDVEIAEYEAYHKDQVIDACKKLIQRFANDKEG